MTTKNLVILGAAAAVLGGAAYFCNSGRKMKAPDVNGKPVLPAFDVSEVAKVDIGGAKKLTLEASDAGWTIATLFGYPADVTKIRENLLKLKDLTVGQTAKGQKIDPGTPVELKDAKGTVLAATTLGGQHMSKPKGQAAQFGGGTRRAARLLSSPARTPPGRSRAWARRRSWIRPRRTRSTPRSPISTSTTWPTRRSPRRSSASRRARSIRCR